MQTSAAFEAAVQHLKERLMETVRLAAHIWWSPHIYHRGVSALNLEFIMNLNLQRCLNYEFMLEMDLITI
jgi:hypothetical protein